MKWLPQELLRSGLIEIGPNVERGLLSMNGRRYLPFGRCAFAKTRSTLVVLMQQNKKGCLIVWLRVDEGLPKSFPKSAEEM